MWVDDTDLICECADVEVMHLWSNRLEFLMSLS
jgi:hypothetical protein